MLGHYILRLRRERKGWSGGYTNPQGGGGNIMAYAGANRFSVIASGLRMITPGSTFEVLQDGRAIAKGTKRGSCAHSGEERGCFFCLQAEARSLEAVC
jgi:hypothetical protein